MNVFISVDMEGITGIVHGDMMARRAESTTAAAAS
jgi:D-aminopeptidase